MKILKLELEYMNGPIWKGVFDVDNDKMCTDIDVVDNNTIIMQLNDEIQDMYNSLYDFNTNEAVVEFDEKKASMCKDEMIEKVKKLISLLEEINDGSFEIQDNVTEELLCW